MKHFHPSIPLLLLAAAVQDANAATANPDTATATRNGGPVPIDVLANDLANPQSEGGLFIVSYDQQSAAYGTVTLDQETNQLIYTPPEDFVGQDTFRYQADDGFGYGGAQVTVNVVDGSQPTLEDYAVGGANKAVAGMLDELCPVAGGETQLAQFSQACSELYSLLADGDTALLNDYLRQIAPDESLTQRGLMAENARNKTARIQRAMAQLRSGGAASLSVNNTALPLGGAAGDGLGSPWTLLSAIQFEDFERNQTGNQAGYDSDAKGLMLGLGYRLNNSLNLGAALDWMSYDLDYLSNSGDMEADLLNFTGFLTWYSGSFGLDVQMGYTQGDSQAQRRFTFPDVAYADSDYDSSQRDLSGQFDWTWQGGAWTLQPFLRIDYLRSEIDAYTETGDSLWLTAVEKQAHEQVNTSAGLDTRYTFTYGWGVMVPSLKLSLVNLANLHNSPIAFQLVQANDFGYGGFELRTDSPDSLFYQWDVSTAFVLAGGWSSFLGLQAVSDYDHVSAYQVSGGVNWEF
jgi:outer membrane lipase/esterase